MAGAGNEEAPDLDTAILLAEHAALLAENHSLRTETAQKGISIEAFDPSGADTRVEQLKLVREVLRRGVGLGSELDTLKSSNASLQEEARSLRDENAKLRSQNGALRDNTSHPAAAARGLSESAVPKSTPSKALAAARPQPAAAAEPPVRPAPAAKPAAITQPAAPIGSSAPAVAGAQGSSSRADEIAERVRRGDSEALKGFSEEERKDLVAQMMRQGIGGNAVGGTPEKQDTVAGKDSAPAPKTKSPPSLAQPAVTGAEDFDVGMSTEQSVRQKLAQLSAAGSRIQ